MRNRVVLGGLIVVVLACGPRPSTAVETQSPSRVEPSSAGPTLATDYVCGHFRMLLTVQRTLDRAEAADYLARCFAVFERNRQVMSPRAFANMTTCAGTAATLEAFAGCARDDRLLPLVVIAKPTVPLSPEDERAKDLYVRAEQLARQGRWAEAIPFYEEAYYIVPHKHGFALKIGIAAWNVGNCDLAKEYLEHFSRYAEREKYGDRLELARQILGEISIQGCATR